ncbi:MAG: hypothetical protein ACRDKL_06440 [Solirubrobacteraceae bacterium]
MGRRGRRRERSGEAAGQRAGGEMEASSSLYTDPDGGELELRGSLSARARTRYAQTLGAGRHQEDARQRAIELLFEQLTVSWTIQGLRIERQQELLRRYRMAGAQERRFVLDCLSSHLEQNFPEMRAP